MKRTNLIGHVAGMILCALASISMVFGQDSPPRIAFRRVISEDESGWTIPGLDKAKLDRPRSEIVDARQRPGRHMYRTTYKVRGLVKFDVPLYSSGRQRNEVSVKIFHVEIQSIKKYDVNGRPFCYEVDSVTRFGDLKSPATGYGPAWILFYSDQDGDGVFETFETDLPLRGCFENPPKWAFEEKRPE